VQFVYIVIKIQDKQFELPCNESKVAAVPHAPSQDSQNQVWNFGMKCLKS